MYQLKFIPSKESHASQVDTDLYDRKRVIVRQYFVYIQLSHDVLIKYCIIFKMINDLKQVLSESERHFLSSIFTILKLENQQRFKSVMKRLSTVQFLFGYSISWILLQRYSSNLIFLLGHFVILFRKE